jgi:flavin-dependent dehydrogenase
MNAAMTHAEEARGTVGAERGALDVLILGGGLAGSAAAIALARAGRRVALLEKTMQAHDKVCGEFLSAEAIEDLRALGVDPQALGAVAIDTVRLAGCVGVSEARLPFRALSLTRRVLDEAMLQRAAEAGALVLRGRTVESLLRGADGWCAGIAGPERAYTLAAANVVVATGKHDLRRLPRPAGRQNDLVAFKMYFRLAREQAAALEGCVELALFRGGYAGLQPVENGAANLCCVVRHSRLRALGGGWERLLAAMLHENAHLRERLKGAEALLARPLAVSSIPYGFMRREAMADGLWAVGDQAAVIPSFTGDGMSVALHSGRLAAQMFLGGESAMAYQRRLRAQVRRQVALATLLSQGLVAHPQRGMLELAARVWPGALRSVAAGTRIAAKHREGLAREGVCAAV